MWDLAKLKNNPGQITVARVAKTVERSATFGAWDFTWVKEKIPDPLVTVQSIQLFVSGIAAYS